MTLTIEDLMNVAPRPRSTRYGNLDCWVVDGGVSPQIPVVLCHGYGAPGTDLVGLAAEWTDLLGEASERFRFVFPVAAGDLTQMGMPGGRAWWAINMARLAEAVNADRFDQLHPLEPVGIVEAREALVAAIEAVSEELGGSRRLVLGGFSQGAMLTMDTALRGLAEPPEVLLQFSGTLVCQKAWSERLSRLENTLVYQSHGSSDPILPFSSAVALRDLLASAKIEVRFHAFAGPHTIDAVALEETAELLRAME